MEKIKIYKNKSEILNCMVQIDGSETDKTDIRLCLELENGRNLYFYGKLEENGACSIKIPKLNDVDSQPAKMFIEAISDGCYFKLYEAEAEIKASVEIKMVETRNFETKETEPSIRISGIEIKEVEESKPSRPIQEAKTPQAKSVNPFIPKNTIPKRTVQQETKTDSIRSFKDYQKSRSSN